MRSKTIWRWCIIGGLLGYFLLHPLVMIVAHFMSEVKLGHSALDIIVSETAMSFSLEMLPWSLAFAVFGAAIGFFYGKIRQAEKELRNAHDELEERVEKRTAELRMANEELWGAKEAADAANQVKSEFLANISHEIRTPMNGVIAATDLALSEQQPPQTERYLKTIQTSAYSLLEIINNILDFTKMESGTLDLKERRFRLDEVLDSVTETFIHAAAAKRIEFLLDIDPETPQALIGDSLRLQQILKYLVDNAVKFTAKEGTILVGAKDIETYSDQVTLSFFIKDTGVGIAQEHLSRIFEPFRQADASSTRKYGGTGLGLYMCARLVKQMGGNIQVDSEMGKGSTFTFNARFSRQSPDSDQEPKLVLPPDVQGSTVLVVDDSADSRIILQKILESLGLRVASAASGEASLDKLKTERLREDRLPKEPFDLIIMDWMMPGMDGIEAARRIRRDLKQILPIILMPVSGQEPPKHDVQELGIQGFLTKPIYPSTLYEALMDAFGKEISRDPNQLKVIMPKASFYKKLQGIPAQAEAAEAAVPAQKAAQDTKTPVKETSASPAEPEEVNVSKLNQLAEALQLADPEAIQNHLKAIKEQLNGSTIRELESRINDYDYDQALHLVKEISKKARGHPG